MVCFLLVCKDLDLLIIIDCRTQTVVKFKTKLGFNQHDIMMTKKQSVLTNIMKVFSSEKVLLQHYFFDLHKIDL